ncbi:hypothetical protein SLEP1_g22765 [Rubroshorea leprosula]|uniref:Uncharacterized protein n=1 Tax=Rubroshorea leprosula TaxID=152421 RepID=A0AAV5JHH5_9ROSI|nr:hypothetical protein SLEP1_g22765 [Rubroshorea leprosula]
MFPLVDHVERGDENQPHNSAHNSASTTNQDVVTAQLAAMQQYESQGQSHIAPAQQPLPDDVTQHLDSLEKLVAEQQGAPPPHHNTDSIPHLLNTNITLEPYPASFKIPQLETYDGTKDPDDHLHAFYSCMQAQNASDALMCKIFPSTLRDNARTWNMLYPINQFFLEIKTQNREIRVRAENGSRQYRIEIKNKMDLRRPRSMRSFVATRDHTKYYDFHQDHGRTIEQCNSLRSELESLAQKGMLNEYIQRTEQPKFVQEQVPPPQGSRNASNRQGVGYQQAPPPLPPPTKIIHTIMGGLEAGGNPPDIMYFHYFVSFGLDPALLQSGQTYVTPSVWFLVVKIASSFNVVIGRPTLTEIRAMVSQSHLCMKFSTPMGIATLWGNQEVARHCYIISVTRPQKGKDQAPETIPQQTHDTQQVIGVEIADNRPEDESRATLVKDVKEVQIDDRDRNRKTPIGTRLNPKEREKLIAFLRANNDVFAWTSANMPGIPTSVSQHELSTNPLKKPIAQKRPASGNERLSLLDAYSGYHQLPMALEDEEKTSFYAGDGIYCYVMMLFGLKNAVKSLKVEDHLANLDETFNNLRKNRMRLNLAKCIFGVESGKFLSFMVSQRGIEVNPETIRAIAEMESPKPVKGIQRLNGRVAALHRFISKSADKCLPFFKIMSVLHEAELRYPIVKKAALVIFTSARKLRPCFQSHPIIVLTDQPLRQILQKLECSGSIGVEVMAIQVYSDSQLVVNQVNSIYEVVDPMMMKYVALVAKLKCKFQKFCLNKIPRTENEQADSLSKFASDRIVPKDKQEAMRLRKKASRYTLVDGVLYKRSFSLPLLWCLNPYEAQYALREMHEGETPYHLAFGTEAVIPIEIGVPSFRVTHFDEGRNGQLLRENLDLLAEVKEEAQLRTLVYKQKLANFYNKRVRPRTFKVEDLVLRKVGLTRFETRFGKLAPNWKALIRWLKCHILVPISSKTLKGREFLESGISIT